MKKIVALCLAVLLPVVALAATYALNARYNAGSVLQNLTGTAPSTATEGWSIGGRKYCTITVCAGAGATITGGAVQAYIYQPHVALWTRWAAGDATLTTGNRCATHTWPDLVPQADARAEIVPAGVTLSAGTQVTTYFRCAGAAW